MRGALFAVAVAAALGCGRGAATPAPEGPTQPSGGEPKPQNAEEPVAFELAATDLIAEYHTDRAAANAKYLNKRLALKVRVDSAGLTTLGETYIGQRYPE